MSSLLDSSLIKSSRDTHVAEFVVIRSITGYKYVVIIGKNNHFFFDSIDVDSNSIPLVLTSSHNPVFLGNLITFIKKNKLEDCLNKLLHFIEKEKPNRITDTLFIVRILYWIKENNLVSSCNESEQTFIKAIKHVEMLEQKINGLHDFVNDINKLNNE